MRLLEILTRLYQIFYNKRCIFIIPCSLDNLESTVQTIKKRLPIRKSYFYYRCFYCVFLVSRLFVIVISCLYFLYLVSCIISPVSSSALFLSLFFHSYRCVHFRSIPNQVHLSPCMRLPDFYPSIEHESEWTRTCF